MSLPVHTRLSLYNLALGHLGERKLASLTEDVETRYLLDEEYEQTLALCLRSGYWNFAMRAIKMESDFTPNFGYRYGFTKPDDWVKTYQTSEDERFSTPYTMGLKDQSGSWLADTTPMYFKFVSSIKGLAEAKFPPDYAEYVGFELAFKVMPRVTNKSQDEIAGFEKRMKKAGSIARSNDAMDQGPESLPVGSWVRSRSGGWRSGGLGSPWTS